MNDLNVNAILPAGGRIDGRFAAETGVNVKALIFIDGRTVLERTLDALRATGVVDRIIVIGPKEIADHKASEKADAVLPEGGNSGPANILRGIEWLYKENGNKYDKRAFIITTDLPFLNPQVITAFLDACPSDADLCAPLVHKDDFEARFPGSDNIYVRLMDGEWTMGSSFLVNPEAIHRNRDVIERVFAVRKSQIGMARLLGIGFIFRLITKHLTIDHIERRCGEILGCTGTAVRESPPELAYDIDHIEEYKYAVQAIGDHRKEII